MDADERLALVEAVAQGVAQGLNGNGNRLFGNGAIRPDSFPSPSYPDWAQWKTHFYRVGRANGWTELQGLLALPVCLNGYALDEYNVAPRELREQVEGADAPTLAALFNHLGREMGVMRNDRLGKADFRKLRRLTGETLRDFGRRVRNIGKIAYSEKDADTRDELFKEKFLEGLNDVRLEVQLLREDPRTFTDLVNRAVDLEVIEKTTGDRFRSEQERYQAFGRNDDSGREVHRYSPEPWKEDLDKLSGRMEEMTQMMMQFMRNMSMTVRPEKQTTMMHSFEKKTDLWDDKLDTREGGGFIADKECAIGSGLGHRGQHCPKRRFVIIDESRVHGNLTTEKAAQIVERASLIREQPALNAVRVVDTPGPQSGVFVKVLIEGKETDVLLDSGAGVNLVNANALSSLSPDVVISDYLGTLQAVDGQPVATEGIAHLKLQMGPINEKEEFVVVPHCEPSVIIGLNVLRKHKMKLDFGKNELHISPFSTEPTKMVVATTEMTDDDSSTGHKDSGDCFESMQPELLLSPSPLNPPSMEVNSNPKMDSAEQKPPGRWDTVIDDPEAEPRLATMTEFQNWSDSSRGNLVATSLPLRKTLFNIGGGDDLSGNLRYEEIEGDVFSSNDSLAHCVSGDFQMESGVAKEVKRRYPITYPKDVDHQRQSVFAQWIENEERYVYHLVTKQRYFEKPTYATLETALRQMRSHAEWSGITRISVPKIGCGRDQLDWSEVRSLIKDVFKGSNVAITVYKAPVHCLCQNATFLRESKVEARREVPSPKNLSEYEQAHQRYASWSTSACPSVINLPPPEVNLGNTPDTWKGEVRKREWGQCAPGRRCRRDSDDETVATQEGKRCNQPGTKWDCNKRPSARQVLGSGRLDGDEGQSAAATDAVSCCWVSHREPGEQHVSLRGPCWSGIQGDKTLSKTERNQQPSSRCTSSFTRWTPISTSSKPKLTDVQTRFA